MRVKITAPGGRYTIISSIVCGQPYPPHVRMIPSTEPQPFITEHFDATGVAVGGSSQTEGVKDRLLKLAADKGWKVEEL